MRSHTRSTLLMLTAIAALAAPVAVSLSVTPDWRASPRFDGQAYLVSDADVVRQVLDPSGSAAVLATLDAWRGGSSSEAAVLAVLEGGGFDFQLATLAAVLDEQGFAGRWLTGSDATALERVATPFIARLTDDGGRLVIVRQVAIDHVYVADPLRGNVLYPLARFAEVWAGQIFTFDELPAVPQPWR